MLVLALQFSRCTRRRGPTHPIGTRAYELPASGGWARLRPRRVGPGVTTLDG